MYDEKKSPENLNECHVRITIKKKTKKKKERERERETTMNTSIAT